MKRLSRRARVKFWWLICLISCSVATSPNPHDGLYHLRTINGAAIPSFVNGAFVASGDFSLANGIVLTSESFIDSTTSGGPLRWTTTDQFTLRQINPTTYALDPSDLATIGAGIDTLVVHGDTMETHRRRGTVSTEIVVRTYVP